MVVRALPNTFAVLVFIVVIVVVRALPNTVHHKYSFIPFRCASVHTHQSEAQGGPDEDRERRALSTHPATLPAYTCICGRSFS